METRQIAVNQGGSLPQVVQQDPCIVFRRASRAVSHLYDLVLAPVGLKATQVTLLQALGQRGGMTQSQLADEYGVSPENLSRRLANLRGAGLIEVRNQAGAGGARAYGLTAAGLKKLQDALPYWARAQERLCAIMGPGVWQAALATADQVAAAARLAEATKFPNKSAASSAMPLTKCAAADSARNSPHYSAFYAPR